ncbi:hypothetical protein FACS1894125_6460 [Actinomycetota bacterium]|nr:hypothetical protein FACS1894125_6460 [Actinomycetota bacterium]
MFYAVVLTVLLPLNLLLTAYAHGTVTGIQTDAVDLQSSVNQFLNFPHTVFSTIISGIIPIVLLVLLVYKHRFNEIIQSAVALILAVVIGNFGVLFLQFLNNDRINSGYSTTSTGGIIIPVYIIFVTAMLIIAGPREKDSLLPKIWGTLYICAALIVIFGILALMSMFLALWLGALLGFWIRFSFGHVSNRLKKSYLIKELNHRGICASKLKKSGRKDLQVREFLTYDDAYKILVYDYDKMKVNLVSRFWKVVKYKDFSLKYINSVAQFEHLALVNYTAYNSGLNTSRLLTSWTSQGSLIFVFDNCTKKEPLLDLDITDDIQLEFFRLLRRAHSAGFVYHNIDVDDLRLVDGRASVQVSQFADLSTNIVSYRMDCAQLLIALSSLVGPKKSVPQFVKYVQENDLTTKEQVDYISEVIAGINNFDLHLGAKKAMHERFEGRDILDEIRSALNAVIDDEYDVRPEVITNDYQRLSLVKVVSIGLTIFAVAALLTLLDWDSVVTAVSNSQPLWLVAGLFLSCITFLGGATALKGFGDRLDVKLFPAAVLQVAASWAAVRLPSALGPITMNMRYLNKINPGDKKVQAGNSAIASIVQAAQALASFSMLLLFGLLTGQSVTAGSNEGVTVIVVVAFLAVVVGLVFVIKPLRLLVLAKF